MKITVELTEDEFRSFLIWRESAGLPEPKKPTSIEDLDLPDRITTCLFIDGYTTIEKVQQTDDMTLLKVPNLGRRHIALIREQIPFKAKAPT